MAIDPQHRATWGAGLAFVVLLGGTLALSSVSSRVPVGDDVVPDPVDRVAEWRLGAHGQASATPFADGLRLQAHERRARATAWHDLRVLDDHGLWDAAVRIRVPGRGRRVQLVVAARGGSVPVWFGSYRIGADGWGWVTLPVTARLAGQDVQVGVIAVGEGAFAEVSHVDLVPMRRRMGWTVALAGLALGWLGLAVFAARRAGPLPTAAAGLLALGVVLPRPWVDVVLGPVQHLQLFGMPFAYWGQKLLGHGGLFACVGFAVARSHGVGPAVGATVTLALATEASQLLAVARSASWSDVGLDLAGAALGVALATVMARHRRRSAPESRG